jgi:hypothetical protein
MKSVKWHESKNDWLKANRNISFEAVVTAIENGRLLEDVKNPNPKWQHQRTLVVEIEGYVCIVPYVFDEETLFLKTVYRSREMNRKHKGSL